MNIFHPPFTTIPVLLLPFIFVSVKFARSAAKILMYVFYIVFILPIAYVYFLVCEAIAFVPCYVYGTVFLGMTKNWQKFTIWIFTGPFILCFQILRGSIYCIIESCEYPEAHLLAYKTLRKEWAESVIVSTPSETEVSFVMDVQ